MKARLDTSKQFSSAQLPEQSRILHSVATRNSSTLRAKFNSPQALLSKMFSIITVVFSVTICVTTEGRSFLRFKVGGSRGRSQLSRELSWLASEPPKPDSFLNDDLYCVFNDEDEALCAVRTHHGNVHSLLAYNTTGFNRRTQSVSVTTYPNVIDPPKAKGTIKSYLFKLKGSRAENNLRSTMEAPLKQNYDIILKQSLMGFDQIDMSKNPKMTSSDPERYLDFTFLSFPPVTPKTYRLFKVERISAEHVAYAGEFACQDPESQLIPVGEGYHITVDQRMSADLEKSYIDDRLWWFSGSRFYYDFFFRFPHGTYGFLAGYGDNKYVILRERWYV